ncbi:hypothetical protein [Streptomyces sp. WAC01280]|uniref:hypothetical protein n=1 Tax=Streptomyces sp. WAC01280 TaxID=2487424 RepID=UPI00163C45E8|nr:hypothetical protein [Streptomyces sp. WAC01280]
MNARKRVLAALVLTSAFLMTGPTAHAAFAPPLKSGGPDLTSLLGHLFSKLSYIL